ncbi:MAG: penicillin-binding protein [Streptococcaceae bacterium]|jgi:penicillin-binding protein|nr:penicillin-binding protein [Streptococcaceae bacterium]
MNNKQQKKSFREALIGLNISMRVVRALFMIGVVLVLLFGSLFAGIGVGYFAYLISKTEIPTKTQLMKEINQISEVSTLNYANGNEISTIKSDLVRTRVKEKEIAEMVKKAVISTEDEHFYEHKGWVPKAVFRAMLSDVVGLGEFSGGSTLTQQLVKQQILSSETTFKRKVNEILIAKQIEKNFSKQEILTTYLNVSPFGRNSKGENIAGVEEAAQGIFGKKASELSIPQAAFIAGLPQSPIVYSPYDGNGQIKSKSYLRFGLSRQQTVLFNMYRKHYLTKEEYKKAKKYDLKQDFIQSQETTKHTESYLYYTAFREAVDVLSHELAKKDHLKKTDLNDKKTYDKYVKLAQKKLRSSGLKVTTTIDENIYNAMQNAVDSYGYLLGANVECGNVLMNNATGAVIGFVGGRNYKVNQNNHAFDTKRSPGSLIKPLLVYGPGIESGLIGSESRISNYPTKYANGKEIMHVDSKGTDEFMSTRDALSNSWNIPAYWIYKTLRSQEDLCVYMKKMGFTIKDYSIESLPMGGGAETTVIQQVNGFQTLANDGVYQKKYLIEKITEANGKIIYQHKAKPVTVFSKATASIMNNLMREVINSKKTTQFKEFLEENAVGGDWVGKTGTSDDYVDAWLVVSTPKMTIGSWSGYDDNHSMDKMSGYTNNSQYLAYLVYAINAANPNILGLDKKFSLDSSVIKSTVNKKTGEKPSKVTVNGQEVETPGESVESFYAKTGAKASTYKFGIGGTDENYKDAWEKILGE